jgi:quercetin dioxygenase-like cupin family protein
MRMAIRIFHRDHPSLRVPLISNDARFVIWLGSGARTANMNYVVMQPGESNIPHVHAESEDTIYILSGHGSVRDYDADVRVEFGPGEVLHIAPGVQHAVSADRGEVVESVGGPCPADLGLLRFLGLDVDAMLDALGS